MRVVLDTNILVSFALRSQALAPLRQAWEAGRFGTLVNRLLLEELSEVLAREKLARYVPPKDRREFLELVRALGEPVPIRRPFPEFGDPKDRYLLAMLRDSDAEALVTGDGALVALLKYDSKPILPPSEFLRRLDQAP